jgi:hypothetical protein
MANVTGKINLFVILLNKTEHKDELIKLVQIDEDFTGVAESIVDKIISKRNTLDSRIKSILTLGNVKGVESTFLLNNPSFCGGYEYEITRVNKDEVLLSLSYTT